MSAVLQQRCLLHVSREAVARCLECRNYYCRECVTEHDGRLICAACLKGIAQRTPSKTRIRWNILAPFAGLLLAWCSFYLVAWLLARLPTDIWGTG